MKRASVIQILSNMGAYHSVVVDDLREYLDDNQIPSIKIKIIKILDSNIY